MNMKELSQELEELERKVFILERRQTEHRNNIRTFFIVVAILFFLILIYLFGYADGHSAVNESVWFLVNYRG